MKKTNPQIRKVGATGPDQKTAFVNEAANDADLQRMIDRFRAGDWPFLLLETEQCRISVRTLDAPEGNCTVTIILKLHGQWKALTKAFPTELGVSMFLACYQQGCLYEDFNGIVFLPIHSPLEPQGFQPLRVTHQCETCL